jgi:hypothetical protein
VKSLRAGQTVLRTCAMAVAMSVVLLLLSALPTAAAGPSSPDCSRSGVVSCGGRGVAFAFVRTPFGTHIVTATRVGPDAPAGDKVCTYKGTSFSSGGRGGSASWSVEGNLVVRVTSTATASASATSSSYAWSNVGVAITLSSNWPDSTASVFYPWHATGSMSTVAGGTGGTASSKYTLTILSLNKTTGEKHSSVGYTTTITGTRTRSVSVSYSGRPNTLSFSLRHSNAYATYIDSRTDTSAHGGSKSSTATGDFYNAGKAWLDSVRWTYHLPSGWTVSCG